MQNIKKLGILAVCTFAILVVTSGCGEQDLKAQNEAQKKQIAELQSKLQTANLRLEQLQRELDNAKGSGGAETDSLQQTIKALEEDIAKKKALIASMQQQLMGGAALPAELNTMLEDFAKGQEEMVTYDPVRGVVKFNSDLLFEPGSDVVADNAKDAIKKLCEILDTEQGKGFDIIIAGHTDDLPISKSETKASHPTNWHLSAHRGISVINIMKEYNVDEKRMSVRGFGEFRPIEENQAGHKGNPKNRRVEIFIVQKGI